MQKQYRSVLLSSIIGLLIACQAPLNTNSLPSPKPDINPLPLSSLPPGNSVKQISTFLFDSQNLFKIMSDFQTHSIEQNHEAILKEAVTEFIADMSQNQTDAYYETPDFAIKLLAGSEGSYFQTSESLSNLINDVATYAMAVVVYSDNSSDIYKGQFADQSFYFSGSDTLPEDNTTYLIVLDQDSQPVTLSGSLKPFQTQAVEASANPSIEPSIQPTASPIALDLLESLPPPANFEQARLEAERRGPEFRQFAGGFRPFPPPPFPADRQGFQPPPGGRRPGSPSPDGPEPEQYPSLLLDLIKTERPELYQAFLDLKNLDQQAKYIRIIDLFEANRDLMLMPPAPPDRHRKDGYGVLPNEYPPRFVDLLKQKRPALWQAIEALKGLPPEQHYPKLLALYQANKDLLPPPPAPESGNPPPPENGGNQPLPPQGAPRR